MTDETAPSGGIDDARARAGRVLDAVVELSTAELPSLADSEDELRADGMDPADAGRALLARLRGAPSTHDWSDVERYALADTVGARLRIARSNAGLSMGQAALLACWDVSQLSDTERDKVPVDGGALAWFTDLYGCSLEWLRSGVLHAPDIIVGVPDKAILLLGTMPVAP